MIDCQKPRAKCFLVSLMDQMGIMLTILIKDLEAELTSLWESQETTQNWKRSCKLRLRKLRLLTLQATGSIQASVCHSTMPCQSKESFIFPISYKSSKKKIHLSVQMFQLNCELFFLEIAKNRIVNTL